jgi:hypothetical protein
MERSPRANFLGANFAMSKGRKGRSPDQIRNDRAEVARLYLMRLTQAEIGAKLGLSRQQVGYDLEAIRQEWLQSSVMDFNARKAEELARIDRLEAEYWDAWEASKKEKETTTSEQTTGGDGEKVKAAIRKTEQTGDPRYLAGVERCIERRCRIVGMDAPVESRLTGPGGGPLQAQVCFYIPENGRDGTATGTFGDPPPTGAADAVFGQPG